MNSEPVRGISESMSEAAKQARESANVLSRIATRTYEKVRLADGSYVPGSILRARQIIERPSLCAQDVMDLRNEMLRLFYDSKYFGEFPDRPTGEFLEAISEMKDMFRDAITRASRKMSPETAKNLLDKLLFRENKVMIDEYEYSFVGECEGINRFIVGLITDMFDRIRPEDPLERAKFVAELARHDTETVAREFNRYEIDDESKEQVVAAILETNPSTAGEHFRSFGLEGEARRRILTDFALKHPKEFLISYPRFDLRPRTEDERQFVLSLLHPAVKAEPIEFHNRREGIVLPKEEKELLESMAEQIIVRGAVAEVRKLKRRVVEESWQNLVRLNEEERELMEKAKAKAKIREDIRIELDAERNSYAPYNQLFVRKHFDDNRFKGVADPRLNQRIALEAIRAGQEIRMPDDFWQDDEMIIEYLKLEPNSRVINNLSDDRMRYRAGMAIIDAILSSDTHTFQNEIGNLLKSMEDKKYKVFLLKYFFHKDAFLALNQMQTAEIKIPAFVKKFIHEDPSLLFKLVEEDAEDFGMTKDEFKELWNKAAFASPDRYLAMMGEPTGYNPAALDKSELEGLLDRLLEADTWLNNHDLASLIKILGADHVSKRFIEHAGSGKRLNAHFDDVLGAGLSKRALSSLLLMFVEHYPGEILPALENAKKQLGLDETEERNLVKTIVRKDWKLLFHAADISQVGKFFPDNRLDPELLEIIYTQAPWSNLESPDLAQEVIELFGKDQNIWKIEQLDASKMRFIQEAKQEEPDKYREIIKECSYLFSRHASPEMTMERYRLIKEFMREADVIREKFATPFNSMELNRIASDIAPVPSFAHERWVEEKRMKARQSARWTLPVFREHLEQRRKDLGEFLIAAGLDEEYETIFILIDAALDAAERQDLDEVHRKLKGLVAKIGFIYHGDFRSRGIFRGEAKLAEQLKVEVLSSDNDLSAWMITHLREGGHAKMLGRYATSEVNEQIVGRVGRFYGDFEDLSDRAITDRLYIASPEHSREEVQELFDSVFGRGGPLAGAKHRVMEELMRSPNPFTALKRADALVRDPTIPVHRKLFFFTEAYFIDALEAYGAQSEFRREYVAVDFYENGVFCKFVDLAVEEKRAAHKNGFEELSDDEVEEQDRIPFKDLTLEYKKFVLEGTLFRAIHLSRDPREKDQADKRNRELKYTNQLAFAGTFVHGTGRGSLPIMLRNGNLAGESIGHTSIEDSIPFHADFVEQTEGFIEEHEGDFARMVENCGASGYSYNGYNLIYNRDERFHPYAGDQVVIPERELVLHQRLLLGGMPSTEISGIVAMGRHSAADVSALKELIVLNGFYIPVYDEKGVLLFDDVDSVDDEGNTVLGYDSLRKDLNADIPLRHVETAINVGGQLGSNEGGIFVVPTEEGLKKYYFKFADREHVWNEQLACELYRALGLAVPNTEVVQWEGKFVFASEWVESPGDEDREDLSGIEDGFIFDCWLANWDVVLNQNSQRLNGVVHRVDNGGAILFRAQGEERDFTGGKVGELQSMRMHPQFRNISPEKLGSQAERLRDVMTDERIAEIVNRTQYSRARRDKIIATLIERRENILVSLDR